VKLFFIIFFLILQVYANQLKKISVRLDWKNQFEFAAFYMAKEKGFYKDVGLDVDIKEYKDGINIVDEVLKGKSTFGLGSSSLILERGNDKRITILSALLQSSPFVLVTLQKSGIKSVSDFKGKKIEIANYHLYSAPIEAMFYIHSIKPSDLKRVKPNFDIQDLIDGKTDIYGAYLSNEIYYLKKKKIKYKIFNPQEHGFNSYNDIVFTSEKMLEHNPQIVKKFIKATLKGWQYALNHIDETVAVIQKKYNTQHKSKDALKYEAKVLRKLAYFRGEKNLGKIDEKIIRQIEAIYLFMGQIKNFINLDEFIYTPISYEAIADDKIREFIKDKKVIKICANPDWRPIEFVENGKPEGMSIDILKLILSKYGLKYKYVPTTSWAQSQEFLKEGKCDILPSAVKTDKRKKFANFTKPYLEYKLLIITRKNEPLVQDILSLLNKTMTRKKGSALIRKLHKKYPKLKILETKDYKEQFEDVAKGKAYFTIATLPVFSYYKNKYNLDNLQIAGNLKNKYALRIAVRKDDKELLYLLDKGLNYITPQMKEIIYQKWVHKKPLKKINYSFLYWVLIAFVIILIILLVKNIIIKKYNESLKKEIEKVKKELEERQKQLMEQSRLAQMGEMISMIAHQWRQPLAAISAGCVNLKIQNELGTLNNKITIEVIDKIEEYTQHLSKTIDDFMNFFKPNKNKMITNANELIDNTLTIVEASIKHHHIKIIKEIQCKEQIETYANELKQVLINIIKNAKDILVEREVKEPEIKIKAYKKDNYLVIEISDNGRGISESIIDKIFDPYFSTKGKNGMGIGLYMSKIIVEEHCKGELKVKNSDKGAVFIIKLPMN